ncbi:MAG: TVP38/TMEM64 family protein [Planctomycetota bacterium]
MIDGADMAEDRQAAPAKQQNGHPRHRGGWWLRLRALWSGLGPAGPLLLLACAGPLAGLFVVGATAPGWLPWFDGAARPGWQSLPTVLGFWLLGSALAAFCMLPTHATSLVAGYLFGTALGSLLGWLVVVLAAALGFAVWHRLVGARVVDALARSPKAIVVHRALLGRGFWRATWLIALLRLSPIMPFAATNVLMASLRVPLPTFLLATVVGVTPRSIAVAWIGAELSELDWQAGGNRWMTVLAIVATVVVVVLVGRFAKAALRRETEQAMLGPRDEQRGGRAP